MQQFREDLVIATFNPETKEKELHLIPEADWRREIYEQKVSSELAAGIDAMLNLGCVLAAVPATNLIEGGASCYLVNLASIDVDPWDRDIVLGEGLRHARKARGTIEQSERQARNREQVTKGAEQLPQFIKAVHSGTLSPRPALRLQREFMHVTLDVPKEKTATFEAQMKVLLPVFESQRGPIRWSLALSAYRDIPKSSPSHRQYLHLWKPQTDPRLVDVMFTLAEDPEYKKLHECVVREEQHITHADDAYTPANFVAPSSRQVLRESFVMSSNSKEVTAFQFGMKPLINHMQEEFGWKLLAPLQNETGVLGTYVHVWEIPDKAATADALAAATDKLLRSPMNDGVVTYGKVMQNRQADLYNVIQYR